MRTIAWICWMFTMNGAMPQKERIIPSPKTRRRTAIHDVLSMRISLLFLLFAHGMCGQPNCSLLMNGFTLGALPATYLVQGFSVRGVATGISFEAVMAGRQTHYNEIDGLYPIPTAPWEAGDRPRKGKVHLDIVTGGRNFGPVMSEEDPSVARKFDRILEFDAGELELHDPSHRDKSIYGSYAGPIHDGYNGIIKLKCAQMGDQEKLRVVLEAVCQAGLDTLNAAKARPKVLMLGEADEQVWIFNGTMCFRCKTGRHRATMMACEAAAVFRAAGCTVRIIHNDLWSGIVYLHGKKRGQVDTRGPCGCHLSAMSCQFKPTRRVEQRKWVEDNERASREADEHFAGLLVPWKKRTSGLTGIVATVEEAGCAKDWARSARAYQDWTRSARASSSSSSAIPAVIGTAPAPVLTLVPARVVQAAAQQQVTVPANPKPTVKEWQAWRATAVVVKPTIGLPPPPHRVTGTPVPGIVDGGRCVPKPKPRIEAAPAVDVRPMKAPPVGCGPEHQPKVAWVKSPSAGSKPIGVMGLPRRTGAAPPTKATPDQPLVQEVAKAKPDVPHPIVHLADLPKGALLGLVRAPPWKLPPPGVVPLGPPFKSPPRGIGVPQKATQVVAKLPKKAPPALVLRETPKRPPPDLPSESSSSLESSSSDSETQRADPLDMWHITRSKYVRGDTPRMDVEVVSDSEMEPPPLIPTPPWKPMESLSSAEVTFQLRENRGRKCDRAPLDLLQVIWRR